MDGSGPVAGEFFAAVTEAREADDLERLLQAVQEFSDMYQLASPPAS